MPSSVEKLEAFKLGMEDFKNGIFRPVAKDVEMDYRRGWLMEMAGKVPEDEVFNEGV